MLQAEAKRSSYADAVEHGGRKREASHIFETGCILRHFGPMSMAVENREQADDRNASRDRKIDRQYQQKAERHDRGEDARLDERDRAMRIMPRVPPASMTPTKAAGQAQIALPPLSAAHKPTAIMTVM